MVEACRPKWNLEDFASRHSEHWALDAVSDHDLDETAHYCRYAFAAYGYLLYIWSQPQYKCGPVVSSSHCYCEIKKSRIPLRNM